MAKYIVRIEKAARLDFQKIYKSGKKADIKKVEIILQELHLHPREGTGNPERLRYKTGEFWSRELNKKDGIVYEIMGREVLVIVYQALGHYSDK